MMFWRRRYFFCTAGIVVGLMCAGGGCVRRAADAAAPRPTPASLTVAPSDSSGDQVAALLAPGPAGAGEVYMGDHLGMNLTLTLLDGGGYSLTWHGCEGLYGAAVGRWRVAGARVLLEPM